MRITREQILATKGTHIYIFGHDRNRKGQQGQCEECAGLPNCYPVTTKLLPCKDSSSYFDDGLFEEFRELIARDIEAIMFRGFYSAIARLAEPIILPKIGRGCAELHIRAPKCYGYLLEQLRKIDPNYEG